MRKIHWLHAVMLGVSVLALVSCTQLPSHISISNKTIVSGTEASFEQCAMSVRFSGPPHQLLAREMSELTSVLGEFAKYELDGLGYEKYRLIEIAICLCADFDMSARFIGLAEQNLRNNKDIKSVRAYSTPYSRKVLEFETPVSAGIHNRTRMFFPTAASKCIFAISVTSDASTLSDSAAFLDRAVGKSPRQPVADEPAAGRVRPKATVSDRLQELDDLHRRKLITEKEYEEKRRAILDGL